MSDALRSSVLPKSLKREGDTSPGGKFASIEWRLNAFSGLVAHLRVRLSAGRRSAKVEVWAEDDAGEELAYSLVSTSAQHTCGRVHWLGRTMQREVHPLVRSRKNFVPSGGLADVEDPEPRMTTLAEALLGFTASMLLRLGCTILELQVMDDGSGKLFMFYSRLGFVRSASLDAHWMEAPTKTIATLVPEKWLSDMVPKGFNLPSWLARASVLKERLSLVKELLHKPIFFDAEHVAIRGAKVQVTATARTSIDVESDRCVYIEASLFDSDGFELATAQGSFRVRSDFLKVTWLGRSQGQPVHPTLKNCRCSLSSIKGDVVTPCIALLGCLAVLARLLGLQTMQMQPRDDGRGRLVQYFSMLGFMPPSRHDSDLVFVSPTRPLLEADTQDILERCCPETWLQHLEHQAHLKTARDAEALPGSIATEASLYERRSPLQPSCTEASANSTAPQGQGSLLTLSRKTSSASTAKEPPTKSDQPWGTHASLLQREKLKAASPNALPLSAEKTSIPWPSPKYRSPILSVRRHEFNATGKTPGLNWPRDEKFGTLKELIQSKQKDMYLLRLL